ncbi:MAG: O-antigen ligase family protein, partial [Anaerolineae bacterium]|nr:O-antigen ligase family protein [Anaerolineae bacterium]
LLIVSPLRTLIATEAQFQLPLDIGQLAFIGLLAFWAIDRVTRRVNDGKIAHLRWSPVYIPALLLVIVGGLTAFSASSIGSWMSEWLKWVVILILLIVTQHMVHRNQWTWLVLALVVAGLANALIGLYEFLGGSGALHLLINDRFFRAFGTFGQPNPFGGFMGLILPLAIAGSLGYGLRGWQSWRITQRFEAGSGLWSAFYAVASLVMFAGLIASWSRGAWMGFIIAIGFMALALPRKLWQSLLLVGGVVGIIALLWFTRILPTTVVERITSATAEYFAVDDVRGVDSTPENYAVVERLAHWQAALNMATANPWLGVGLGNYEIVYNDFRLVNWREPLGHAHNIYLNILAEAGVIGLLGYGKAWLMIIGLTWRARQHPDTLARLVVIGLLGSWTYLTVHHLFDSLYVNNLFIHLGLMLGILGVLYNQAQQHIRVRTA